MSLSEQEQRALREIEQSLFADDPKFGRSVSTVEPFAVSGGQVKLKAVAIGMVGLLMLIGGVAASQISLWFIALSIAGFLVMFLSGIWALKSSGSSSAGARNSARSDASLSSGRAARGPSTMEENFRRRFER
ncbi:DUF3040 domain-containing protein [Corynebacterium uterequi]|uniref:Putative DUF3040 family protein n=1 Tax=Corynebacterium uterequi TaxID=1072256 RepID=A0A0G3HHQ4_9CORY|nr:DUF3040 domain-containing protein [Corynebacterium uterequi]AKK11468.1 putative DUF3040 family protein [Corynebacterium uterequi]